MRGAAGLRQAVLGVVALTWLLTASGCFLSGDLITQRVFEDARRRRERGAIPTLTPTATPVPATATPIPTRTPQRGRTLAFVLRVWDGNTILIEGGSTVRYIGVIAPGAGMFGRPLEPFGREAAERNLELVEGQQVEIEMDVTDVDAAGYMLRYVYVDGVMVNELLLREGLARVAPSGANVRYAAALRQAEVEARAAPVNIWTLVTPTFTVTRTPVNTLPPMSTPRPTPTPPATVAGVPRSTVILRPTPTPTTTATATPSEES